jgi:hypothetical protein
MSGIYNLSKELEGESIFLSFRGPITPDLLSSVSEIMERRPDGDPAQKRRVKMFYHLLVECLQNVFHHSDTSSDETKDAIFMLGNGKDNSYRIITGNNILNSGIEALTAKIEKINAMNAEQLHAYYLDKLNTTEISQKGGAGLGLIEMARKSGNKIDYDFRKIDDKNSFFTLTVTVK